jgi:hypothetical protein
MLKLSFILIIATITSKLQAVETILTFMTNVIEVNKVYKGIIPTNSITVKRATPTYLIYPDEYYQVLGL